MHVVIGITRLYILVQRTNTRSKYLRYDSGYAIKVCPVRRFIDKVKPSIYTRILSIVSKGGHMCPVEVVTETTLVSQIAAQLRNAIVSGELKPGERIRQDDFAERFGVSRTPLREALVILEGDGFVVLRPRAGFTVVNLSFAEAENLSVMRLALEPLAVSIAAEKHSDDDVPHVLQLLERTMTPINADDKLDRARLANRDLHFALYGIHSGLVPPSIAGAIEQFWVRYERYRHMYWRGTERENPTHITNHTAVVEAWIDRDSARAEREMAHHVLGAMVGLLRTFDEAESFSPALEVLADRYQFDLADQIDACEQSSSTKE